MRLLALVARVVDTSSLDAECHAPRFQYLGLRPDSTGLVPVSPASSATSYQSASCPPQDQPYSYPPQRLLFCRGRFYLVFEHPCLELGSYEVRSLTPSSELASYSLLQERYRCGKVGSKKCVTIFSSTADQRVVPDIARNCTRVWGYGRGS